MTTNKNFKIRKYYFIDCKEKYVRPKCRIKTTTPSL